MNTDGNLAALAAHQKKVDADEAYDAALEAITNEIWQDKIKLADAITRAGEGDIDEAILAHAIWIWDERQSDNDEYSAEDWCEQQGMY